MKLSIIIPYYNVYKNMIKLLETLIPQLTDETEVLIIDDGCNEWRFNETSYSKGSIKCIHLLKNSGGASVPRNEGLNHAKGKYIVFIDSDDMVSNNYIETILNKIDTEDFDYCYISWKGQTNTVIIKDDPPKWNCCVWNCIYKRSLIGNIRFNPELKIAEDYEFNSKVRKGKKANITDILYYYNEQSPNSLTKQGQIYNEKYRK